MNKILLGILIAVGCITLVSAAWYFIFTSGLSIRVDSLGSQKDVILNIPSINLNTSESSAKGGGITTFSFNKAGTFQVSITETIGDLSGGQCLNNTGDCSVTYSLDDGTFSERSIYNGQTLNISANSNVKRIVANISCVAYSCPQTRDVVIKLNQLA